MGRAEACLIHLQMDGDGPEGSWLRALTKLIDERRVTLGALIMEGNQIEKIVPVFQRLQVAG